MKNNKDISSPGAVDQAMNTVLQAERAARQAIADCEQEAQEILNRAHSQARRLAERTDERLALAHTRSTARVGREIKAREHSEKAARFEQTLARPDEHELAAIVAAVAADLTAGASPADDQEDSAE